MCSRALARALACSRALAVGLTAVAPRAAPTHAALPLQALFPKEMTWTSIGLLLGGLTSVFSGIAWYTHIKSSQGGESATATMLTTAIAGPASMLFEVSDAELLVEHHSVAARAAVLRAHAAVVPADGP